MAFGHLFYNRTSKEACFKASIRQEINVILMATLKIQSLPTLFKGVHFQSPLFVNNVMILHMKGVYHEVFEKAGKQVCSCVSIYE